MKTARDVFAEVIGILEELTIPYLIGGSVAAIAYGEPRLTLDMDVVIDLAADKADLFSRSFGPEYYVSLESIKEAIKSPGHFNIIQSEAGVKVDFYIMKKDEFGRAEFSRKKKEAFDEKMSAFFASPEDVIVKKLEWFKMGESQKHLEDIKGILKISGEKVDLNYIDQWTLKNGTHAIWEELIAKLSSG